ncbi:MAG: hypothetical protein PF513_00850 [Tenericutes bacterium]|jgi:PDZ domain-containing protein|nr:hypothetical protein [Mycoplasmatota bacterium]
MKELTKKLWPIIRILIIPYIILMFLLVYRIDYLIYAPGGITEVESVIDIDYEVEEIKGSISSTYIISFKRPTFFQFVINDFSKYNEVIILPEYYRHYTDQENREISYLQKMTSVDAAVIVAYQLASEDNDDIIFEESATYHVVLVTGKAEDLSNYDSVGLGDEFISMIGESDELVTDINDLTDFMIEGNSYTFNFKNEEALYQVDLTTEDIEDRALILTEYLLVNEDEINPKFTENDSNIGGPSGGLLQTLSIYNNLIQEDITHGLKIAGTGTIRYDGSVGYIGGVKQKIATAYINKVDLFFIPAIDERYSSHNYIEALAACEEFGIDPEGWLIPVATIQEAIDYLEGIE